MLLVFGAGGQVGRELIATAARLGVEARGLTHAEADICDKTAVEELVRRYKPTSIVNAAAYTAVDRAESEPPQAFRVNRDGAAVLGDAAAAANIPLVHLSTDYVFDGQSRIPYAETDEVAPLGVYGRSKEEGERAIRASARGHVILRTAWVYSPFGTNFVRTMLRLGLERAELGIVDDQTGCPTSATDIAAAVMAIVEATARQGFSDWGTYHYVGADVLTWYGFAKLIFEESAKSGVPPPRLLPIMTADFPTPAPRPAYSVLDTKKIERIFAIKPRALRESLLSCLETLSKQAERSVSNR